MLKHVLLKASLLSLAAFALTSCGGTGGGPGSQADRIYVVDGGNDRIVRINNINGGDWTTLGSSGSGTNQFNDPTDIAFDSTGRIYIADYSNSRIVRMDDMTGAGWVAFGTNGSGVNQFNDPYKIAIDSQDRIYMVDSSNNRIVRINNMTGSGWVEFGTFGTGTNQFDEPVGIALDSQERIYVTDWDNDRIVRVDNMSGANWTTFGSEGNGIGQFGSEVEIIINPLDKMVIADRDGRIVQTNSMSTTGWVEFSPPGAQSVDMDIDGRVFVVDQSTDQLRQYSSMLGGVPNVFGTSGSGVNQFASPTSVVLGP